MGSGVDGVLVGRGVLRNPWILAQAADLAEGRAPREVTPADRGRFLLEYIELLLTERVHDSGVRTLASLHRTITPPQNPSATPSHDRWVVNKLRALASWYTKGLDNGSHLRTAVNSADSLEQLRAQICAFFCHRYRGGIATLRHTNSMKCCNELQRQSQCVAHLCKIWWRRFRDSCRLRSFCEQRTLLVKA